MPSVRSLLSTRVIAGPGSAIGAGQRELQCLRHLQPQRGCWLSLGDQASLTLLLPALVLGCPQGATAGAEAKPHWSRRDVIQSPDGRAPAELSPSLQKTS